MRVQRMFRFTSASCLLVMLLALGAPVVTATPSALGAPQAPNGGMISGMVSSPGGYPLESGTLVRLFDAGTETVRGVAMPETATGTFQFGPVRNGLYVIKAVPPEGSAYTQSLPKAVSVVNAPVNVGVLALTEPQISGSVLAPDGTTQVDSRDPGLPGRRAGVAARTGPRRGLPDRRAAGGKLWIASLPERGSSLLAVGGDAG